MIIAVASDAHGANRQMDALLERLPAIDVFCFLGDVDKDGAYLDYGLQEMQPKAQFYAVAGNNDPFSRLPKAIQLDFDGVKTLITHGHLYSGIRLSPMPLARQARQLGIQLAFYGHTHVQADETEEGVRLVNPGALSQGRWALATVEAGGVSIALQAL